tara:strand:- start:207 stop:947 length:741 start_codon:yes stop_codon:yes gene_type:complete
MTKSASKLSLWAKVEKTDPAYTKAVSMRGGYTAIDPQYQLLSATAMWGPYGGEWALRDVEYEYIRNGAGEIVEIAVAAEFFFPGGQFPISADMAYRPGDDCRKKVMTSARSKALSMLGFNADVFMGKFDDNHYVQGRKQAVADETRAATDDAQNSTLTKNLYDLCGCDGKSDADQIVRFVTDGKCTGIDDARDTPGGSQAVLNAMRGKMADENLRHFQLKDAAEAWCLDDGGPTAADMNHDPVETK